MYLTEHFATIYDLYLLSVTICLWTCIPEPRFLALLIYTGTSNIKYKTIQSICQVTSHTYNSKPLQFTPNY